MQPERLPHLRARRFIAAPFRNPRGGGGERLIPERDAQDHSVRLLANLERLEEQLGAIDQEVARPPGAEGHLVAADALEGAALAVDSLGDRRADIAVVAETEDGAVLHIRRDDISPLRRKIAAYGTQVTTTGRPRNEPLVAPLEGFRPATLADLSDGRLTEATVEHGRTYWVELWVRGGRLADDETRRRVRREVEWLVEHISPTPAETHEVRAFQATERDVYLLRVPGEQLHQLPSLIPDVYRIVEATPPLRDFLVSQEEADLVDPEAVDPPAKATTVVVLDTGVAPEHPLLVRALRSSGASVVVADPSPVDTHGHGTEMAGLALYADLGGAVVRRERVRPRAHLASVRLIPGDQQDDDDREFWAERTERAVIAAEEESPHQSVFNLSISAPHRDPGERTSWSSRARPPELQRA